MADASDRIPYDVHAKLEDPMGELAFNLGRWEEDRDDSKPQSHVRRAAGKALDAIDVMLRELQVMRARLVSEIRVSDAAAAARSEALLGELRREAGLGETGPVADVAAFCRGCRRSTVSVPCKTCEGPACGYCRRCPDCDDPDEEE